LVTSNTKGSETERIVSVVQLADSRSLSPDYTPKSSPKGLEILLHGSTYLSKEQSFKLTLLCEEHASEPYFAWYDGSTLAVDWKTPAGCGHSQNEPPKDDDKGGESPSPEKVGSGIGYFFLV
jgi:autophagy-related protein 27